MRPTDKATADSRSLQSFAIIKNTGNGNFVLGRFHTRARNGLFAGLRLACVQSNPPRQTPLVRFFLRGGDGCTEARHIGLCKADRTTWKLTLQDNNTTPKEPKTERVVAVAVAVAVAAVWMSILYTGYLKRMIHLQTVRQNWQIKSGGLSIQNKNHMFNFQIKTCYPSDANYQTDNPSHTNSPSLVWKRPFMF